MRQFHYTLLAPDVNRDTIATLPDFPANHLVFSGLRNHGLRLLPGVPLARLISGPKQEGLIAPGVAVFEKVVSLLADRICRGL